jgi:hypothetical protein
MSRSAAGRLGYVKALPLLQQWSASRRAAVEAKTRNKRCAHCKEPLPYEKRGNKYCSHSCFASATNRFRSKPVGKIVCGGCNHAFTPKNGSKVCSLRCHQTVEYKRFVKRWLAGDKVGGSGSCISRYVRRWLIETYGEKCSVCGWSEKHPVSGRVPVQIDHRDGDGANHTPENLHLLCPNCHSLTSTFGGRNRGRGRVERRARYSPVKPRW